MKPGPRPTLAQPTESRQSDRAPQLLAGARATISASATGHLFRPSLTFFLHRLTGKVDVSFMDLLLRISSECQS
jgi:hypothetical protein